MKKFIKLLVVYSSTLGISFSIILFNIIKIIEYLADKGFVLNLDEFKVFDESFLEDISTKISGKVIFLLPFINIIYYASFYHDVNKQLPFMLEKLEQLNLVKKMDSIEKNNYKNNKTSFLSFYINMIKDYNCNDSNSYKRIRTDSLQKTHFSL